MPTVPSPGAGLCCATAGGGLCRLRLPVLLLLTAAALPSGAAGQAAPFPIPRLAGQIDLDGRIDEDAWLAVPVITPVSSSPVFGAPPSERTEFRIAHDDEYLYVAGRMYDAEPAGIRATSLRRDDASLTNDWFAIILDTFMDRQTALVFGVTPAGVRTDGIFARDGEAPSNFTWNTFWDARATVDAEGWSAEIRVPLSSLRFEVEGGRVVMGATIWRFIARRNETISWPAIEHHWGLGSVMKASQTHPVSLEGVRRLNPAYLTPYLLSGPSMSNRLDAATSSYARSSAWSREVGLDVKYSPMSNVVLDVTLNTDFAQVEADDQQVNLTRFSLFFPERRLFFQERAELFEFGMGDSDRLFHSRRMGLVDGMPVRIYGGVRATGRVGAWDIGFIDLQTAGLDDAGSENAGVLRLRRRVLNPNSYAGTIFTSRIEADGGQSFAGGADALLALGTRSYLSLGIAASLLPDDSLDIAERSFARVRWERRGNYGLRIDSELAHVGGGFDPTLGFLARRDHLRATGRTWWGWRMPESSSFLRQSISVGGAAFRRYADRAVESAELSPHWYVETVSGHSLTFAALLRHEDLTAPFSIAPGLSVPAGVYRFGAGRVSYNPAQTGLLRFSGNAEVGRFFDGSLLSASVSPTWNVDRHLQLSGTWQVNQITFPARDQERVAQVARIRSLLMLNSQLSGVALLQYNSASDAVLINLRARYNPREGNDLYVVYNHGLNTDRLDFDPVRPLTDNRTLLLKYSHTLRMQR